MGLSTTKFDAGSFMVNDFLFFSVFDKFKGVCEREILIIPNHINTLFNGSSLPDQPTANLYQLP